MKILHKILKSDIYTSHWVVLLIDISMVVQTFILANLMYYNFKLDIYNTYLFHQIPFIIVVSFISFILVGSHKGIIRHTGINDAFNVFIAVSLLTLLAAITVYINRNVGEHRVRYFIPHSISILLIHYFLNVVVLIASRFVFKQMYNHLVKGSKPMRNVLIYGAGDSGLITLSTILNDKNSKYNVIGFVDDNPKKLGKHFNRIKVFSRKQITKDFIDKKNLKEVIFSIQKIDNLKLLEISESLVTKGLKVKIVPAVEKWIDGDLNVNQIKEIQIEDLLDRSPIELDNPTLRKEFYQKTILITGAAGSIGSEITRQITKYDYKQILILDQAESPLYELQQELKRKNIQNYVTLITDIRNYESLSAIFNQYKIDIIFHAAAYKHVPLMENNPYESVHVNIKGTKQVMDLAVQHQVEKFVMVSTDKAVNPTNVMGASKRVAEIYAKCLQEKKSTKFITTRFGNVLGSNGSVIPLFKKQLAQGGPLTVTHKEITRFFMTIPEACQLVLEAGAMGNGGEIYVFDMGKSVKIFDLAKKMIHLSGFKYPEEIDIKIVGLRPGEKLYEELLSDEENTIKTYHEKIMIAKVKDIHCEKMTNMINELALLKDNNKATIVSQIKQIVPEYISKNSEYEKLDH